ncbi:hypothetical protein OIV83_004945 [Microbotryomycetes sp. JL201]|nr:hypothetical protein OIV83_004945 [Microbotryomycetes sp. JL201]
MAATAQDEQRWLDGSHPALQANGHSALSLNASEPAGANDKDSDGDDDVERLTGFDARDDDAPSRSSFTPPLNSKVNGTANTGPKGVLADYHARGQSTTNTGPKGVLNDWTGNQLAAAGTAFKHLHISNKTKTTATDNTFQNDGDDDDPRLDDEDWVKAQYRKQRIAELKGSGERGAPSGRRSRPFGHLREIGIEQFLSAVEDEAPDVAIVIHIYEPEISACAQLNSHLATIARGYPQTKFLRALASEVEFATDVEEDTLPTMLVYRAGELETSLIRPDLEWGRGNWSDIVSLLKRHDAITGMTPGLAEQADVDKDTGVAQGDRSDAPVAVGRAEGGAVHDVHAMTMSAIDVSGLQPQSESVDDTTAFQGAQASTGQAHVPPPPPVQRGKRPPKSILKQPTVQPSRFNWKRDILQPLNTRLANAAASASASAANSAAISHHQDLHSLPSGLAGTGGAGAAALQQVAAGFWGNALKKLSGVTAAAAGVADNTKDQPYAANDVAHDDGNAFGEQHGTSVNGIEFQQQTNASESQSSAFASASTAAPYTPTSRAASTSSTVASSAYATGKVATPTMPPQAPPLSVQELKRVRFRMASLKIVYPINGPNGPLPPYEERKTKKRIDKEYRAQLRIHRGQDDSKGWNGESLVKLYAECCKSREERPNDRIRQILLSNPRSTPRVLDLSNEQLSHGAVEALADLLSVDFGLKKLVLEECALDDTSIRPLLHALLVSGNIATVSLAKNKKIRSKGFKYIAIFMRKARLVARFLRYLDLSEINIDRRSSEFLVQALTPYSTDSKEKEPEEEAPIENRPFNGTVTETVDRDTGEEGEEGLLWANAPLLRPRAQDPGAAALLSLRLENCGLRGAILEALAHGVRSSSLKHISIRRNRINVQAAVSLAIMIRDYPLASDPASIFSDLSATTLPLHSRGESAQPELEALAASGNSVTAKHALQSPFTRRTASPTPQPSALPSPVGSPVPPPPSPPKDSDTEARNGVNEKDRELQTHSEARNRLRKQIDELPRTGSLLTLDVKGNDIRNGVFYIAQVLKRNRTLKVLNLSENKIDAAGLTAIGEALKFNTTLETLDMSINPCCGPGLDGINALRTAIMIHPDLKRVFLNSTDMTSEGAISLAEFLPEAKSLIHLDLTGNFEIDIAGVLALSVSVKMNHTVRCLDLNIPPNDSDFARLSQDILQCCIRNTEHAQEEASSGGKKLIVAAPILNSVVARDLQTQQEAQIRRERRLELQKRNKDEILVAAEEVRDVLNDMLRLDEQAKAQGVIVAPSEVVRDALVQAQLAEAQLAEAIAATRQGDQKAKALSLGDDLTALLDRAKVLYDSPGPQKPPSPASPLQHLSSPVPTAQEDEPSSPGFTIGESDDDEAIESDQSRPSSPTPSGLVRPAATRDEQRSGTVEGQESSRNPIESQSRSLTLEEGEVFRRGTVLGAVDVLEESDDDDDDDDVGAVESLAPEGSENGESSEFSRRRRVSGEQLRKEILGAEVEKRSPRTSFGASSPPS